MLDDQTDTPPVASTDLPRRQAIPAFDPADHYWRVGGDETRVWSSAKFSYVPSTDQAYEAWLARGLDVTTPIASEDDLVEVLHGFGLCLTGACRTATGYALVMALTDDQRALYGSVKPWDQRRLSLRGSDHIPEDNPLIARVAAVLKTDPKAWFDAALSVAG